MFLPETPSPKSLRLLKLDFKDHAIRKVIESINLFYEIIPDKWSKLEMDAILPKLGDLFDLFDDTRGWTRGFVILWDKKVSANLLLCSLHHIDVLVQ